MHIHILGICGTFMGSLAQLAKELGHKVTGSDANVYPPMSTQLEQAGIELIQGFDPIHLNPITGSKRSYNHRPTIHQYKQHNFKWEGNNKRREHHHTHGH